MPWCILLDTSSLEFFESDGETTNPTFSSVTKNFGFGIWDVGVSTVEGIIDIVKHPVETAKGLGYAVTHPIETGKGIWGAVTTSFTNFKEGNADVKARILGNVTGEIGLAVLTSKGIDKAAKTLKSSKFLKGTAKGWFGRKAVQLTKSTFGHTFTTHGDKMTKFLLNRARGSNMPQGQFLNNQKAAGFILRNIDKVKNGSVNIPMPKDFPARVIMPDGSFATPTHIRLIPGGNGVKTAYPLILGGG